MYAIPIAFLHTGEILLQVAVTSLRSKLGVFICVCASLSQLLTR